MYNTMNLYVCMCAGKRGYYYSSLSINRVMRERASLPGLRYLDIDVSTSMSIDTIYTTSTISSLN
jgi:hypothetical protein